MANTGDTKPAKSVLLAASVAIISTGLAIIGVGAFFLKRLDDHAFGDPGVFYAAVRHYASVASAGVPVCLAGCIALAIVLDYKQGFRAGVTSIFIAFAVAIFGLFLFPIHDPSGTVYFSLLGLTFGASLQFGISLLELVSPTANIDVSKTSPE